MPPKVNYFFIFFSSGAYGRQLGCGAFALTVGVGSSWTARPNLPLRRTFLPPGSQEGGAVVLTDRLPRCGCG